MNKQDTLKPIDIPVVLLLATGRDAAAGNT